MKCLTVILALIVLIDVGYGCEKHRRMMEARRLAAERMNRAIEAQRAREIRRAQEQAMENVRRPLRQYVRRQYPAPLNGGTQVEYNGYGSQVPQRQYSTYRRPSISSSSSHICSNGKYQCTAGLQCNVLPDGYSCSEPVTRRYPSSSIIRRKIYGGISNIRRRVYPTYVAKVEEDENCEDGYSKAETPDSNGLYSCLDINECDEQLTCGEHSTACYNSPGGYKCSCKTGFVFNTTTKICQDIDECLANMCAQTCTNTPGSFECSCKDGYTQGLYSRSGNCDDINECNARGGDPCNDDMICVNMIGAYQCVANTECPENYRRSTRSKKSACSFDITAAGRRRDADEAVTYRYHTFAKMAGSTGNVGKLSISAPGLYRHSFTSTKTGSDKLGYVGERDWRSRSAPYTISLNVDTGLMDGEEESMEITVTDSGYSYNRGYRTNFSNKYVFIVNVIGYTPA